jgi:hypothetical protein
MRRIRRTTRLLLAALAITLAVAIPSIVAARSQTAAECPNIGCGGGTACIYGPNQSCNSVGGVCSSQDCRL